ncbi:putative WRKY transcription factor 14 [Nymphaea thermarum]|nr:putative WRKY transcription factor 14 [Nymphaea thermarum]
MVNIEGIYYRSRGYYRCGSSKGCSTRKQVERNRKDTNKLAITYTLGISISSTTKSSSSQNLHFHLDVFTTTAATSRVISDLKTVAFGYGPRNTGPVVLSGTRIVEFVYDCRSGSAVLSKLEIALCRTSCGCRSVAVYDLRNC